MLMSKANLSEDQAYGCMMQAHQTGMGLVGKYPFERAEFFHNQLTDSGLTTMIKEE